MRAEDQKREYKLEGPNAHHVEILQDRSHYYTPERVRLGWEPLDTSVVRWMTGALVVCGKTVGGNGTNEHQTRKRH